MTKRIKDKIKELDLEKLSPKDLYYVALIMNEVQMFEYMSEYMKHIHTVLTKVTKPLLPEDYD